MEKYKFGPEDDGAIDVTDRPEVQAVWSQVEPDAEDGSLEVSGSSRYENAEQIGPEGVEAYGEDRAEENLQMLEEIGNPRMVKLYKKIIEENPQLRVVKLIDEDCDGNAWFHTTIKDTTSGQVMPAIRFDFSHPDSYRLKVTDTWVPRDEKRIGKLGIRYVMKKLALRMGADWRRCARNKNLASSMAFLHEMGHAQDFIDNCLAPEYSRREGISRDMRMVDSLVAAKQRYADAGAGYDEIRRLAQNSPEMAVRSYRDIPDERHADEFALDYLSRHHDEYFIVEEGSREEPVAKKIRKSVSDHAFGEERIRMEFGREMPMDEDFAHILGLAAGCVVRVRPAYAPEKKPSRYDLKEGDYGLYGYEKMKKYDAEGRYIAPRHARDPRRKGKHEKVRSEGVALTSLREGGPVYVREGEGYVTPICDNATGCRYVSTRDSETGQITTRAYYDDDLGRVFEIEHVED